MENLIVIAIILGIAAGIVFYLIRAKKRGQTCIGCPYAKNCKSGQCSGHCGTDKDSAPKNS